jgi:hypothetical protein
VKEREKYGALDVDGCLDLSDKKTAKVAVQAAKIFHKKSPDREMTVAMIFTFGIPLDAKQIRAIHEDWPGVTNAMVLLGNTLSKRMYTGSEDASQAIWELLDRAVQAEQRAQRDDGSAGSDPALFATVAAAIDRVNKVSERTVLPEAARKALDPKLNTGSTLWCSVVEMAVAEPAVRAIVAMVPELANAKDDRGRKAYDLASDAMKLAIDETVQFCRRYKIDDAQRREHVSKTCVVLRGEDVVGADGGEPKPVVIKLMKNEDQYRREVDQREALDSKFCVEKIFCSDEDPTAWQAGVEQRGYTGCVGRFRSPFLRAL